MIWCSISESDDLNCGFVLQIRQHVLPLCCSVRWTCKDAFVLKLDLQILQDNLLAGSMKHVTSEIGDELDGALNDASAACVRRESVFLVIILRQKTSSLSVTRFPTILWVYFCNFVNRSMNMEQTNRLSFVTGLSSAQNRFGFDSSDVDNFSKTYCPRTFLHNWPIPPWCSKI